MVSAFHKTPKAWAQIKHSILGNYLSLFLGKLGRRRIYYVDGFAGPGRLEDGSKGSPLIAAELAESPRQPSRAGVLQCINVEENQEVFTNLERSTAEFVRKGLVTNLHGSFVARLPEILAKLADATAFFFIDPFGTEGAELDTINTITYRQGKTEILVRYDDTRVKRLIMWATNNEDHFDESHRRTALAFKSRVDQLTDEQAAADVQTALVEGQVLDRTALIEGYARRVTSTTSLHFSLSYPIRNPETKGHRYYLVHFCQHPDGFIHMANFMAKVERSVEGVSDNGLFRKAAPQLEFLCVNRHLAEEKSKEAVQRVCDALPDLWRLRGWMNSRVQNRDLYAAIVGHFKWTVLRNEYIAALRRCADRGYVRRDSSDDDDFTYICG